MDQWEFDLNQDRKTVYNQIADSTNYCEVFRICTKSKVRKSPVYIARIWYSRFQFTSTGKQFKEFHIKRRIVSGNDLDK